MSGFKVGDLVRIINNEQKNILVRIYRISDGKFYLETLETSEEDRDYCYRYKRDLLPLTKLDRALS